MRKGAGTDPREAAVVGPELGGRQAQPRRRALCGPMHHHLRRRCHLCRGSPCHILWALWAFQLLPLLRLLLLLWLREFRGQLKAIILAGSVRLRLTVCRSRWHSRSSRFAAGRVVSCCSRSRCV